MAPTQMMARTKIITARRQTSVRRSASAPRVGAVRPALPARKTRAPLSPLRAEDAGSEPEKEDKGDFGGAGAQQLLGFRQTDADEELPKWKVMIQLTKPGTWIPVCWGVMCGAAASGNYHWIDAFPRDFSQALACVFLSGPCLTGFTQTINDWYDKDLDAINEPNRPIPSGRVTGTDVAIQAFALMFGGWAIAWNLDQARGHEFPTLTAIALFGTFISYIYSAPPLKLKANGWQGTYALGASYIALPWWAGQSLFGELTPEIVAVTLMYSFAGLGIAIVNDFKSVEGDRALGLKSIPVEFGIEKAKYITVATIDGFQGLVALWLLSIGEKWYALAIAGLMVPQIVAQFRFFLPDPVANDVKYQANAQPFLVLGILTTAFAVGHNPYH